MSVYVLNAFALASCIIGAVFFVGMILKFKAPRFSLIVVCSIIAVITGGCTWHFAFIDNKIISYLVVLIIEVFLLKTLIHFKWQQAIFSGIFDVFHLICSEGIATGILALILKKNLYQIVTVTESSLIALIIAMVIKSILYFIYGFAINRNEFQSLFRSDKELETVVLQDSAIFVFMLFGCYNYYYNLDLIWFTVVQILLSILTLVLFMMVFHYGMRVSYMIENDVHNELVREQLRLQLSQHVSYQNTFADIDTFKRQFREDILTMEQLIDDGNIKELRKIANDKMPRLLEMLPEKKEFSNNEVVNALLLSWYQQCSARKINFQALIFVASELSEKQKEFSDLLIEIKDLYCSLTLQVNGGHIKIEGKNIKTRFVLQVSGSYSGSITERSDLPYFKTRNGIDAKSAYHRIHEMINSVDGTLFWDADETSSLFKLTVSIRF